MRSWPGDVDRRVWHPPGLQRSTPSPELGDHFGSVEATTAGVASYQA